MKPILRFPEFKDEWEINKLGLHTNVIMGQSPSSKNYTNDSNNIVLVQGNADLQKGKIYPRIYTTEITKIAEMNDIILTVRAPVGELAISQMKVCIGRGVCAIKGNTFIYSYLNYLNDKNYWKRIAQGSTFESISGTDVKNIPLKIPSEKEQEKIGRFFSKLNQQIELEEKKLQLLEQQKKGYMQKIFSKKLRFKDENGNDYPEWKKEKLINIVTPLKGQDESFNNLPVLTISASRGWLNQKERFSHIIAGKSLKKYTQVKKNDLSYNKGNSKIAQYGTVFRLENEALVPNVYKSFRPNKDINSVFIEKYFHNKTLDKQLRTRITSTARADGLLNISDQDFYDIKLYIPILQEQIKIGNFLEKIDDLIEKQNLKIKQLKQRKKGLLQKMFV